MQATQSARVRSRYPVLDRLLEASWLAAVALVPLAVAHENWMIGFVQMAKIGVFRTIVAFMLSVAALRWALEWRPNGKTLDQQIAALRTHPARYILAGVAFVLAATLVSLAFSPVKSVSLMGVDPGWDTYALINLACYLVVFGVVAVHLRSAEQVQRLLWTIAITAVVTSFYGIGQHFGIDLLRVDSRPQSRANLSFGNPIFAGSFLVMTIPLTLVLVLSLRDRVGFVEQTLLGTALVAPQAVALIFTLSRGPWVGMMAGGLALLVLLYMAGGRAVMQRAAVVLVASALIALVFVLLPIPGAGSGADAVGDRLSSIVPEVGDGLNYRWTIWTTAAEVFLKSPWVDTEAFPELPGLALRPLRPLFGYGPDMFGYAYPLAGESTYTFELATHGHNFLVHTALELGLLGVAAYLFLAGATALVLARLFLAARAGGAPLWYTLLLAGLGAVFVGRAVEQIPGKAQVSDLLLTWVLLALVVTLTSRPHAEAVPAEQAAQVARRRSARRAAAPQHHTPLSVPRVIGAAMLTVLVLLLWSIHVLGPVNAAFTLASGQRALNNRDAQRAAQLYQQAVDTYPALSVSLFRLGQLYFESAQNQTNEEQKVSQLKIAYESARRVLERNPLDHRALSRAAEYHRELAVAGEATKEEALREAEMLIALMPGFWQSQATLGWSYVRLGDYEAALQAAQRAKELDNKRSETYLIYYVEAVALAELGRREEALEAIAISLERRETPAAQQLQARLQGGQG